MYNTTIMMHTIEGVRELSVMETATGMEQEELDK